MLNESGGDGVVAVCAVSAFYEQRKDAFGKTRVCYGPLDCAADQF
jgi:hypothetical protein